MKLLDFYRQLKAIRPARFEVKQAPDGVVLTEQEQKELPPSEMVKMVMTRGKDDDEALYDLLGTKEYRKELDKQFKTLNRISKLPLLLICG